MVDTVSDLKLPRGESLQCGFLPNSDLNVAVDFWVEIFPPVSSLSFLVLLEFLVFTLARLTSSAASYRGAKCPTLKTAEKQPKRVPSGS